MTNKNFSAPQGFRQLAGDLAEEIAALKENEEDSSAQKIAQEKKTERERIKVIVDTFLQETEKFLNAEKAAIVERYKRTGKVDSLPTRRPAYDVPREDTHYLTSDDVAEHDDSRQPGYHLDRDCFSRRVMEALEHKGFKVKYESTSEKPYGQLIASW